MQIVSGEYIAKIRRKTIALTGEHLSDKWNLIYYTDKRVRLMSEILTAIRLVKLYAWETSFAEKVALIRKKEVREILKQGVIKVFNHR
jgi:hypothetical protein